MNYNWNVKADQQKYNIGDIYHLIEYIYKQDQRICIYVQKERFNGELDNLYGLQFNTINELQNYVEQILPNITHHTKGQQYITIDTKDKYRLTFILYHAIQQIILDYIKLN